MNNSFKEKAVIVGLLLILGLGIYGLGDALFPLLFSFAAAYLVFPLIKKLEKKGISRNKAIISIFTLFVILTVTLSALIIPGLISDAINFSKELPAITSKAILKVESISSEFGVDLDLSKDSIHSYVEQHFAELTKSVSGGLSQWLKGALTSFTQWFLAILNLFLIPLFFFYVINDFEKIVSEIRSFLPKSILPKLNHYMNLSNTVLSGYIRGQLMVALILGGLYAFGLSVIGLKFGFLIGLVSGLISIIPYAGFTLGFITAMLVALANYSGMGLIVGVVAVFLVVQALEGTVITPKFVGDKVGLSSLATILALIIGGNLLGMAGMILAIPVAAIIKSILSELKKEYHQSDIYNK